MSVITIEPESNLKHPFRDISLADAINIANGIASLRLDPPPHDLREVRALFVDQIQKAGHVWITGLAALDLLDAAIENRDITQMDLRV